MFVHLALTSMWNQMIHDSRSDLEMTPAFVCQHVYMLFVQLETSHWTTQITHMPSVLLRVPEPNTPLKAQPPSPRNAERGTDPHRQLSGSGALELLQLRQGVQIREVFLLPSLGPCIVRSGRIQGG